MLEAEASPLSSEMHDVFDLVFHSDSEGGNHVVYSDGRRVSFEGLLHALKKVRKG